jgi:hypothetical protein
MKADIQKKLSSFELVDYSMLGSMFPDYLGLPEKISRMVKSGDLVRLKKGLYILAAPLRTKPIHKEVLANLIYGPSYVSLQSALGHYGLIPERVETLTSMTTQRDKVFETPIGAFSYKYVLPRKYNVGIALKKVGDTQFLIATPEKALADLVAQQRGFENKQDVYEYLTQSLRIEQGDLASLHLGKLREIAQAYRTKPVTLLSQCLENMK